ncbi:thioredoxin-like protein [Xylaria longipes]|nr:thioredoxin-like protein [Xylaria longipes]
MPSHLRTLLKLFKCKKTPPLACHMTFDQGDNHVNTSACFLNVQPLALAEISQSQGCKPCDHAMPTILEATKNPILQRARDTAHGMDWRIYLDGNNTNVKINSDKLEIARYNVVVIVYEDKSEVVKIGEGPSKGKKVPYKNVAKDIVKIGEWTWGDMIIIRLAHYSLQNGSGHCGSSHVQEPLNGPIVAVTKIV